MLLMLRWVITFRLLLVQMGHSKKMTIITKEKEIMWQMKIFILLTRRMPIRGIIVGRVGRAEWLVGFKISWKVMGKF